MTKTSDDADLRAALSAAASDKPILHALRRQPLPAPPVWLMRQAGRYLPEYQEVRRLSGGFLAMCHDPEAAAEVTLQPVRRFGVDAAILFSDILLPLAAMGMELEFHEGHGPVLPRPLAGAADIASLLPVNPAEDLDFVGAALKLTKAELPSGTAMLGFCGAPYTLACYALEGGNPKQQARVRGLMHNEPALFRQLLDKLADVVSAHLRFQIESGADAVVLFDTWAGDLDRDDYREFAAPASVRALAGTEGLAPRMAFVRGSMHLLDEVASLGTEGMVLDWRSDIGEAFDRYGDRLALQGNLDPTVLLGPPDLVRERTRKLLAKVGGRPGHILALGHGVIKETDPEAVAAFVETARAAGSA